MKRIQLIISVFLSVVGLLSCEDKPENPGYSEVPYIELESLYFDPNFEDTYYSYNEALIVEVSCRDRDRDLGLNSFGEDTAYPYHLLFVKTDKFGKAVVFDRNKDVWSCKSFWVCYEAENTCPLIAENGDTIQIAYGDTVAVEHNKYYRNFDVQLLVKENGIFKVDDFTERYCTSPLGGRFPRLELYQEKLENGRFVVYQDTPWNGTITYHLGASRAFWSIFNEDTLKLRIQIFDRALHESNIIESAPFTLESISIH